MQVRPRVTTTQEVYLDLKRRVGHGSVGNYIEGGRIMNRDIGQSDWDRLDSEEKRAYWYPEEGIQRVLSNVVGAPSVDYFSTDIGQGSLFIPEEIDVQGERHMAILKELNDIYRAKNEDYGDSYRIGLEKYGHKSALYRMSDKWLRLEKLILSDERKVKDESLEDTLMDLANYCVMLVDFIREQ